jgi:hypothetical protein
MHFFRSEEHLRNWAGFDEAKASGIISLADLVNWFSIDLFRRRLDPDYISHYAEYGDGFIKKLFEMGKRGDYWIPENLG